MSEHITNPPGVENYPGELSDEFDPKEKENKALEVENEYPLVSDTGKRYRYIAEGLREYQSGARYQEGKGLVKPADNTLITVDNTAEYAEKRLTKAQNKALEGMREAIADNRNLTEVKPGDEAKYWGIAVTERMLAGEKDSMVAARLLGEGPLELLGRRGEGTGSPTNGQVSLTLTGNVSDLRQVMGNRYAQTADDGDKSNYRNHEDAIDAEVTDHSAQE